MFDLYLTERKRLNKEGGNKTIKVVLGTTLGVIVLPAIPLFILGVPIVGITTISVLSGSFTALTTALCAVLSFEKQERKLIWEFKDILYNSPVEMVAEEIWKLPSRENAQPPDKQPQKA